MRVPRIVARLAVVGLLLTGASCADPPSTDGPVGEADEQCVDLRVISMPLDQGRFEVFLDEGGELRPITPGQITTSPRFSPDGSELVVVRADGDYESAGPASTELWVIDADGSNARDLVEGVSTAWEQDPAWSPDGRIIVFSRWTGGSPGGMQLMTVPATGGRASPLTEAGTGRHVLPAWSPDGGQVAFVRPSEGEGPWALMVVAAAGGEPRVVAEVPERPDKVSSVTWTPDGAALLLGGWDGDARHVDVDTGETIDLEVSATQMAWSQDGERLHYLTFDGSANDEYVRGAIGHLVDRQIVRDTTTSPDGVYAYDQVSLDVGPCLPPTHGDASTSMSTPRTGSSP